MTFVSLFLFKVHPTPKENIAVKGDGHLGSISAHAKLFIKPHDFNPNYQLDMIKLDLYMSKGK